MNEPVTVIHADEEAAEAVGVELVEAGDLLKVAARDQRTLAELDPEDHDTRTDLVVPAGRIAVVQLSTNFKLSEFHCSDGRHVPGMAVPALRRLARDVLQPMRERWGAGQVISGYRHRAYNKQIGGAANSRHIYDEHPGVAAADLIYATGSPRQWAEHAAQLLGPNCGIGVYRTFVHIDNDPSATRRW